MSEQIEPEPNAAAKGEHRATKAEEKSRNSSKQTIETGNFPAWPIICGGPIRYSPFPQIMPPPDASQIWPFAGVSELDKKSSLEIKTVNGSAKRLVPKILNSSEQTIENGNSAIIKLTPVEQIVKLQSLIGDGDGQDLDNKGVLQAVSDR